MNSSTTQNYYVQTKKQWIKNLSSIMNNKQVENQVLRKYIGAQKIPNLKLRIHQEFEHLLTQLPEPGSEKKSIFKTDLIKTTMSLAFYRILKEEGFELHQIGQILYEVSIVYYKAMNPIAKLSMRWYYLFYPKKRMKKKLEVYKKKANSSESKLDFVDGDGKNLLFGLNYIECVGLKLLKAQNAMELAPYLCLCDYPMYQAINLGFNRTQNLALGGKMCEFRFYKKYPAPPLDWPPVNISEYKNFFAEEQNK